MVFSILKELLSECRGEYLKLIQNKSSVLYIRPMSTVIMDEKEERGLLEDLQKFLGPQSRT